MYACILRSIHVALEARKTLGYSMFQSDILKDIVGSNQRDDRAKMEAEFRRAHGSIKFQSSVFSLIRLFSIRPERTEETCSKM